MSEIQEKNKWFKEGDEVAHIDNLKVKMWVEELIFKIIDRPTAKDAEKKETVHHFIGVRCHWFDFSGNFHCHRFHKDELVPWVDAEKLLDHKSVMNYLDSKQQKP